MSEKYTPQEQPLGELPHSAEGLEVFLQNPSTEKVKKEVQKIKDEEKLKRLTKIIKEKPPK